MQAIQAAMALSPHTSLPVFKYNDYLGIALTALTFHSDQFIFISLPFYRFPSFSPPTPIYLFLSFFSVSFFLSQGLTGCPEITHYVDQD